MQRPDAAADRLVGFGAFVGASGGALRITSAFIPYVPDTAWLEALYAACDLGMLFGLIAIYLATAGRVGLFGLVTFVVALAALASIVGPDSKAFGVDFYRAGATVFVCALAGFAGRMLVARIFTVPAVLWIACAALGMLASATGSTSALAGAGLALGGGFIAAGVTLFRQRSAVI